MTRPRFHDGFRLVATPSAVSCSRLFVAYTLDKWGASFVINDAVQVVDELVTNAAHATGLMEERPRWTALAALLHHRAAARLGSEYPYRGLGQCA